MDYQQFQEVTRYYQQNTKNKNINTNILYNINKQMAYQSMIDKNKIAMNTRITKYPKSYYKTAYSHIYKPIIVQYPTM